MGILEIAHRGEFDRARDTLNRLMDSFQDSRLKEDLNGQVREAIAPEAYRRWGRHYLPSLALAHWTQQCNNFLDKGIQDYGGLAFSATWDLLDKAFNELPAPTPTHRAAVVQRCRAKGKEVRRMRKTMGSYNSCHNTCFAGHCRVHMADKSFKACQDVRAGDVVETSIGASRVVCVLKTPIQGKSARLVTRGRLAVTPWHPILVGGLWTFPNDIGEVEEVPCDAVYCFLLEAGARDLRIEDTLCIALAHGIEDDAVASHPFYGTQRVVDAMREDCSGFSEGLVEVVGVERDAETGLVNGLRLLSAAMASTRFPCGAAWRGSQRESRKHALGLMF